MYMCRGLITLDGTRHEMTGCSTPRSVTEKAAGPGIRGGEGSEDNVLSKAGGTARGHVFHYSHVIRMV